MTKDEILRVIKKMIQGNYHCSRDGKLLLADLYAEMGIDAEICERALREGLERVTEHVLARVRTRWRLEVDLYAKAIATERPHYDYRALKYYTPDVTKTLYRESAEFLTTAAAAVEAYGRDNE